MGIAKVGEFYAAAGHVFGQDMRCESCRRTFHAHQRSPGRCPAPLRHGKKGIKLRDGSRTDDEERDDE